MSLKGKKTRLRAVEPEDIDLMYLWENDPAIWGVSGTLAPFSRHTLERFIEEQRFELFQSQQQRLIIETLKGEAVGILDLFELDPVNGRAGIGVLIHDKRQRRKGFAADALESICRYAHEVLHLHQLWCSVGVSNPQSLALFQGAGFEQTGIKRAWNRTEEGYEDEILLQKLL